VTVGGAPATIQFIGIPNGLVGVSQLNYTIPAGTPAGTATGRGNCRRSEQRAGETSWLRNR